MKSELSGAALDFLMIPSSSIVHKWDFISPHIGHGTLYDILEEEKGVWIGIVCFLVVIILVLAGNERDFVTNFRILSSLLFPSSWSENFFVISVSLKHQSRTKRSIRQALKKIYLILWDDWPLAVMTDGVKVFKKSDWIKGNIPMRLQSSFFDNGNHIDYW